MLTILCMIVLLFAVATIMLCSFGALKDSKTATGVLSFSLPPTSTATGFNVFLGSDGVYAGNTTTAEQITTETNNTFVLFLEKNASNASANAYFKLVFTFYGTQNVTYNGNAAYFKKLDNTTDAILKLGGEDTTSLENSKIFTFNALEVGSTSNKSLSNYTKLVLDPIFAGFSCAGVNNSNVLKISAFIYEDSAMTQRTNTSSTYCKYSSGTKYSVTFNNTSDKCSISGNDFAIEGSSYTFSVTTNNGYKAVVAGAECTSTTNGNVTTFTIASVSGALNLNISTTPIDYTITYNLDGGTLTGQKTTYTIETETFTLPTPTKSGYDFIGWTGSNGTTVQTSVSIAKGTFGNKNYTANWEEFVGAVNNLSGATYQIFSAYASDGAPNEDATKITTTTGNNATLITGNVAKKWKMVIGGDGTEFLDTSVLDTEATYNNLVFSNETYTATISDGVNNWNVTLTTKANTYISMSFESINTISANSTINLSTLLINAEAAVPGEHQGYGGSYCWALTSENCKSNKTYDAQLVFYADNEICNSLTTNIKWAILSYTGGGISL